MMIQRPNFRRGLGIQCDQTETLLTRQIKSSNESSEPNDFCCFFNKNQRRKPKLQNKDKNDTHRYFSYMIFGSRDIGKHGRVGFIPQQLVVAMRVAESMTKDAM
jgi:hypothetical protein